jgi:membrane protease YdiL (CAAX protease family)
MRIFSAFVDTRSLDPFLEEALFDIVLQIGILFLLPLFLYSILRKQKVGQTFKEFKFRRIGFIAILIAIGMGILCYFLNVAVASVGQGILGLFGYEGVPTLGSGRNSVISSTSVWALLINLGLIAVLPAIGEETTHRGLLLGGMSTMGFKRAIILSSLMFGLIHLNVDQTLFAFVLGALMAFSVVVSGSIIPAMIIHFINNGINVYLSHAEGAGWIGGEWWSVAQDWMTNTGLYTLFFISLAVLVALVAGLLGLYWLLFRQTRLKRVNKIFKNAVLNTEDSDKLDKVNKNKAMPLGAEHMKNIQVLNQMLAKYNVSTQDLVFGDQFKYEKPTKWDNLFFWASLALGSVVTVFTFVWGWL